MYCKGVDEEIVRNWSVRSWFWNSSDVEDGLMLRFMITVSLFGVTSGRDLGEW
jgi:hypothetical protein